MALNVSNELKTLILNLTNPVGSVYINSSNTNPGTVLGGTWVRVPNGYLRNNGTAAGMATGGSLTTGSTAITVAQLPSHRPSLQGVSNINANSYWDSGINDTSFGLKYQTIGGYTTRQAPFADIGSTQGHTHSLEPSFVNVYAWRRTV